ncbi:MAG: hypothetical protein MAG431_02534 [Chloroflexi bacterium]|nr:hypothetical protein [Chloroflexota bacterium]
MKKLGFHYFPDTQHYRQQDLEVWLPRLRALGASWLTLIAPSSYTIPENFLKGLRRAKIRPLVHFPFHLDRLPGKEDFRLFFQTYARWGVKDIILFNKPNTRAQWGTISWAKTDLVERFLDLYLPLAEEASKAGLRPIFPPLEQGGDYWDTSFLWAVLAGIKRRGPARLVDELTLSVDANPNDHSLGWGAGGSYRWPEARPYFTPPGSEDQRGFRIADWYLAISQAVLGKTPPVFMLNLQGDRDSEMKMLQLLAQKPPQGLESLPTQVRAGMFWLLAAEEGSKFLPQAWYKPDGETRPIVERLTQKTPQPKQKKKDHFEHYLLLPTYQGAVTDWHLEVIRGFVKKHTPTIGFSTEEAAHAKRVTVIGGESDLPETDLNKLRARGCIVQRITGSGTEIAAKLEVMSDE